MFSLLLDSGPSQSLRDSNSAIGISSSSSSTWHPEEEPSSYSGLVCEKVLSWPHHSVFELGSHKTSTICPDLDILNQLVRYCWFRDGYVKNKQEGLEMLPVILRFAPFWGHSVCDIARGSNFISQGLWKEQLKPTSFHGLKLNAPARETSNSSLILLSGKSAVGWN